MSRIGPTDQDKTVRVGGALNFADEALSGGGDSGNTLPLGHRLHEFEIQGLIGEGGFGIVYKARDLQLNRTVALKEYMPAALARRSVGQHVSVRSSRQRETFELGLRSFVNEARLLAAFDHPALVKVYRFWEQNGTAYMVMPYYQGPTLKEWLIASPPPDEQWVLNLMYPLMEAIDLLHQERCYHRDIAPDNILLVRQPGRPGQEQGVKPVLLDFGAARRVIGDATQALTVILKAGYAPIEQYAEAPAMKQGPWTDVYALAAVLYAAIARRAPLPSVSRLVSDDLEPASKVGAGRYTPGFLAAIDKGLAVRPENRPQDMKSFRALFNSAFDAKNRSFPERRSKSRDEATRLLGPAPEVAAVELDSVKTRPVAWIGGGVAILVAVVAAGWFATHGTTRPVRPTASTEATAAPAVAPVAATTSAAPAVAKIVAPFAIVTALNDIVRRADPVLRVSTIADKPSIVIGRDKLRFRVKSSEAGYVYVFLAGTDNTRMHLLFPNGIDQNNRIEGDTEMTLPRRDWQITAGGPPGTNHLVVVVSRQPRDLSQATRRVGGEIPELDLARAEQLWRAGGTQNPLLGDTLCTAGPACDQTYGASMLRIDEVVTAFR